MNYMDYSDDNCMNMFSEGQKAVMDFVLGGDSTSFGYRSHLVSEENLIATGVNDGAIAGACTPKIAFTARPIGVFGPKTLICEGENVSINSTGAQSYIWSPALGLNTTQASSVIANPITTTFYSILGTDANGCSDMILATVNVNPKPIITFELLSLPLNILNQPYPTPPNTHIAIIQCKAGI